MSIEEKLIKRLMELNDTSPGDENYGISYNPKDKTVEIIKYRFGHLSEVQEVFCKREEINRNILIPKLLQRGYSYLGI